MILSVSQVVKLIRKTLTKNPYISEVKVEGELQETRISGNNVYCVLIEENKLGNKYQIKFFADISIFNKFNLSELKGKKILVIGELRVFNSGDVQINAHSVQEGDIGEFEKSQRELDKMCREKGYYDAPKKIKPKFCFRVGVVTSKNGAAIGDISNFLKGNKYVKLYICHSKVQGKDADIEIAEGIKKLDKMNLDAIIVGRGGGSKMDLLAFNSKNVIEAIFNAKTLIASAVGHERDTFIIDRVSDLKYITPTDAAKELIGKAEDIEGYIKNIDDIIQTVITQQIAKLKNNLEFLNQKLKINSPQNLIMRKRTSLIEIYTDMKNNFYKKIEGCKLITSNFENEIIKLTPAIKLGSYRSCTENFNNQIKVLFAKNFNRKLKEMAKIEYELEKNSPIGKLENGTLIAVIDGNIVTDTTKVGIGDYLTLYSKQEELLVKIENRKPNKTIKREYE